MTTPARPTLAVREQPAWMWWVSQIPTTAVLFLVAVGLTVVTAVVIFWRLLHGQSEGDIGQWLAFLGALLGIERLGFAAKRATAWKPPETTSGLVTAEPIDEAQPVAAPLAVPRTARVGPLTPLPADPGGRPEDDPNHDLPGRL